MTLMPYVGRIAKSRIEALDLVYCCTGAYPLKIYWMTPLLLVVMG